MIQLFRRKDSLYDSICVKLHGLDAKATYTLTNLDVPGKARAIGRELLEKGLSVPLRDRPGAAIITYKRRP